jgi:hypothetical protein
MNKNELLSTVVRELAELQDGENVTEIQELIMSEVGDLLNQNNEDVLNLHGNARLIAQTTGQPVLHDAIWMMSDIDHRTLLEWSDEEISNIESAIKKLHSYRIPQQQQLPIITQKITQLTKALQQHSELFKYRNIAVHLDGSMYFGDAYIPESDQVSTRDPSDIDISFIVFDESDIKYNEEEIERNLVENVGMNVDINTINISELTDELEEHFGADIASIVFDDDPLRYNEHFSLFVSNCAVLLCGQTIELPNAKHAEIMDEMQQLIKKIKQRAQEDVQFRVLLITKMVQIAGARNKQH